MSCFVWLVQPNDLNNTHLSYDKNGNITSLHRSEGGGYYLDELDYVYNGNQVVEISDRSGDMGMQEVKEYRDYHTQGDDFTYDANGNMTVDLDRNIVAIRYNLLNLPDTIQFKNGNQLINQYDAAGCLLQRESVALHSPMSVPLTNVCTYNYDADVMSLEKELYMDNCEYTLQKRGLETIIRSSRYNNNEGYTLESGMMGMHPFYQCKDHLGSIRELFYVDNNQLYTLQTTEYYADGLPTFDSTGESAALEKYNGKKYIEMHGYDCSDYGARHYYPTIGRFTSVDPLAEKYPSISPYAYCANNPVNAIDPDGRDAVIIVFPDYKISTPVGKIGGLGHAGVLLIDNKTGYTKYNEYGRYDKAGKGEVKNRSISNVTIGKDGMPTQKSLNKVMKQISDKAGHGGKIEGAYVKSDKFKEMNDYAKGKMKENSDPDRKKYNFMNNNCGTFAEDVVGQDKEATKDAPSTIDPRPNSMVKEYQGVHYDPKAGKTTIDPKKEEEK